MSETQTGTTSTAPAPAAPAKKPRSPVERAVVWGAILALLALVGIEYVGYRAQTSAMGTILGRLQSGEGDGKTVRAADVRAITGREPVLSEDVTGKNLAVNSKRVEVYRWFTLSPFMARELWVYYGIGGIGENEEPDVVNVTTGEDTEVYKHATPSSKDLGK